VTACTLPRHLFTASSRVYHLAASPTCALCLQHHSAARARSSGKPRSVLPGIARQCGISGGGRRMDEMAAAGRRAHGCASAHIAHGAINVNSRRITRCSPSPVAPRIVWTSHVCWREKDIGRLRHRRLLYLCAASSNGAAPRLRITHCGRVNNWASHHNFAAPSIAAHCAHILCFSALFTTTAYLPHSLAFNVAHISATFAARSFAHIGVTRGAHRK